MHTEKFEFPCRLWKNSQGNSWTHSNTCTVRLSSFNLGLKFVCGISPSYELQIWWLFFLVFSKITFFHLMLFICIIIAVILFLHIVQLKVLQAVAFQVLCAALDDWAMLTSHLLWHLLKNNLHGLLHLSDIQILLELHPLELHLKNMQGFQTHILTLMHWEVLFLCQGIPVPLRHLCTLNCTQITIFHALREMGLSAFTHYHSLLAL